MTSAPKHKKRGRKRKSSRAPERAFPYRARATRPIDPQQAEFLDETIAIWQPRANRQLSREDAREIVENITGFFSILREWDQAERLARTTAAEPLTSQGNGQQPSGKDEDHAAQPVSSAHGLKSRLLTNME